MSKNFAIDLCSNNYILSLDGDEALDHNMRDEVIAFKNSNSPAMVSISKGLQTIMVLGQTLWLVSSWKLRLFHKDYARWSGKNPHDIIRMNPGSKIEKQNGEILHYSYLSVSDHVAQTNKFTTIAAKVAYQDGKR